MHTPGCELVINAGSMSLGKALVCTCSQLTRFAGAPAWLIAMIVALEPLLDREFVGRHEVEINIYKGHVANVNLNQRQSFK